jgi:hypothetical protein
MWLANFYRFYAAIAAGAVGFVFLHSVWAWIGITILFRAAWFGVEYALNRMAIDSAFRAHQAEFRQLYGPYGIRMTNKAETDARIRRSLAEVFVKKPAKLRKAVEQLEVMDTLFQAGMRPEGDEYLLHDLKLKYGRHRLAKLKDLAPRT